MITFPSIVVHASISNNDPLTATYDAAGRLIQTNGFAETHYLYDGSGWLSKEVVKYGGEASGFTTIISHLVIDELAEYPRVVGEDRYTYQHESEHQTLTPDTLRERREILYNYAPLGLTAQKVIHYSGDAFDEIESEEISFPQTDHNGSIMSLVRSDGKTILSRQYDAYGNVSYQEGNGWTTLGYNGERVGTADGLIWMRARHYNPMLRRWMQRDDFPGFFERPQSRNRYAYAEGDPVNNIDPSGNAIGHGVAAAVFAGASIWGWISAGEGFDAQLELTEMENTYLRREDGIERSAHYSPTIRKRINELRREVEFRTASAQLSQIMTTLADKPTRVAQPISGRSVPRTTGRGITGNRSKLLFPANPKLKYYDGKTQHPAYNDPNAWQDAPYQYIAPSNFVYASLDDIVYRGDPGVDAFTGMARGFQPRGDSNDLFKHVQGNQNPPSAFVPTTHDLDIALRYVAGRADHVFVIRPRNGADVVQTMRGVTPSAFEHEVAIWGHVYPEDIYGVTFYPFGKTRWYAWEINQFTYYPHSVINPKFRRNP